MIGQFREQLWNWYLGAGVVVSVTKYGMHCSLMMVPEGNYGSPLKRLQFLRCCKAAVEPKGTIYLEICIAAEFNEVIDFEVVQNDLSVKFLHDLSLERCNARISNFKSNHDTRGAVRVRSTITYVLL
jgi:hypothetical protein